MEKTDNHRFSTIAVEVGAAERAGGIAPRAASFAGWIFRRHPEAPYRAMEPQHRIPGRPLPRRQSGRARNSGESFFRRRLQ